MHFFGTLNQSFYIDYFYLLLLPWICEVLEVLVLQSCYSRTETVNRMIIVLT